MEAVRQKTDGQGGWFGEEGNLGIIWVHAANAPCPELLSESACVGHAGRRRPELGGGGCGRWRRQWSWW